MILQVEHQSPTWRALKRHIEERIDTLHRDIESPHDIEATATIRGQIKELRGLIERVEPPVREPSNPDTSKGSLY